ncbi:MAG: nucleoside-diphosphate kinase [Candidatus Eisenbacteria bacterium]|nr:nucleoside-diphosphate kinase [Candidatus Eisenbacteria bacterium]
MQKTLLMIKPDATERALGGRILARVEEAGLRVERLKLVRLRDAEAREFYRVHAGKPFLEALVAYIASGPVWAAVLSGEDAIARLRELVGATDPARAAPGTLREAFGCDLRRNAVHASDGPESAAAEIGFFGLTEERDARGG